LSFLLHKKLKILIFFLVNLKRSKSAPGLIEASYRLPYHAPVRRTGSGIQRLSSIKESDIKLIQSITSPTTQQQTLTSSNSLLTVAPLASSISVTSSSNSGSIEHLKKCLNDLRHESDSSDPIVKQRYIEIENRLKLLQDKTT
jgi:hypothetical protein